MRSYENSGYNPYNENDRSETRSSGRNYSSRDFDNSARNRSYGSSDHRTGELGSGRDVYSSSGYGNTSQYGRSAGSSNYGSGSSGYGSGSSNYGSSGSSNYGSSGYRSSNYSPSPSSSYGSSNQSSGYGSNYNSPSNYGSGSTSGYGSSGYGSNRYGSSNYDRDRDHSGRDSWDRTSDRVENAWDRTKNRVSNAWDRATDDDDRHDYRNRNYNTYGSGYGTGSRYGSTSSYDRDRHTSDFDRDRHDRGFFDRAGDEIKSWFGDEEAERRRRRDERHDREHDNDYNRYGRSSSSYGSTQSGPPYSYGSSSRRDYEW